MSWFVLSRGYAALYGSLHDTLHVNLPGFGTVVDRVREDHELVVNGLRLHFDHRVGRCYGRLLAGEWNEAETHRFLRALLDRVPDPVTAVDVGAFIGELALELARHPRVASVVAFEPQPLCAAAIARSAGLNGFANVEVVNAALSDAVGTLPLVMDPRAPSGAALGTPGQTGEPVRVSTLDRELAGRTGPALVKIDVEGAELDVLRGGRDFLARARPLVVFEYNHVTRRHFRLDDLRPILGDGYEIVRLRSDGLLDRNLRDTWNCVAIPAGSPFSGAAEALFSR